MAEMTQLTESLEFVMTRPSIGLHHRNGKLVGYATGHIAGFQIELGERAWQADDVEAQVSRLAERRSDPSPLARMLAERYRWGKSRAQPSEYARKVAAEAGWPTPIPLGDAYQPNRELRAAGVLG